ncbi:MAG: M23 family metallopeptidase [Gemmatimonadaceae bacterium]
MKALRRAADRGATSLELVAIMTAMVACFAQEERRPASSDGAMTAHAASGEARWASSHAQFRDTLAGLGAGGARVGSDGATLLASPSELRLLHAELVMPLAGIAPGALVDSFDEARGTRRHQALDIPAPRGTPVRSAAAGRVLKLFTSKAGGLMVYAADASERFILMYAHLDGYAANLHEGVPLAAGDVIGFVGTTGNAPPGLPHLHFAIARTSNPARWWTGTPVNPRPLLQP